MQKIIVVVIALTGLLLAQPAAAAPLGAGMFSGASNHDTSGSVTVSKQGDRYVVELGGDFSLDGAPDPYVALGSRAKPVKGGLIAVLKSNKGAQSYAINASTALAAANQVIIWCKKYSVPLGLAAIK